MRNEERRTDLSGCRRGARRLGQGRAVLDAQAGQDDSLDAESLSPVGTAASSTKRALGLTSVSSTRASHSPNPPAAGASANPRSGVSATSRNAHWRSSRPAIAIAMVNVAYGLMSSHSVGVVSPAPKRTKKTSYTRILLFILFKYAAFFL